MPIPPDIFVALVRDFDDMLSSAPPRLYPDVELFNQAKADASLEEAVALVTAQDAKRRAWLEGATVNAERARKGLDPVGGVKVADRKRKHV